jgi:hypothetical protein
MTTDTRYEAALGALGGTRHYAPPLTIVCTQCGAEVGRRCLTASGTRRKESHGPRTEALGDADELWAAHWTWLGLFPDFPTALRAQLSGVPNRSAPHNQSMNTAS